MEVEKIDHSRMNNDRGLLRVSTGDPKTSIKNPKTTSTLRLTAHGEVDDERAGLFLLSPVPQINLIHQCKVEIKSCD